MRLIADVWVPGVPVTKGSVNVNRGGRGVRQAAKGYAPWSDAVRRTLVTDAGRRAVAMLDHRVQRHEAAVIRCRFWVPRPASADAYGGMWAPGARDGDKLDRAVWDAVTAAGLWQDDAQVVEWAGSRRWADTTRLPGAHIAIYTLCAAEVLADPGPREQSREAYGRAMLGGAG